MLHKKSLGQHFLHSSHYLELIADAAKVTQSDDVLEIGPGEGALTKVLLARGATVIAIEKDHRLIPILNETFAEDVKNKKLRIVEADALEEDCSAYIPSNKKYKVVANIPYYITGALLRKFLTQTIQPSTLVFLVQKEVAERIARHGAAHKKFKESLLSLSVKAYGDPTYVKTVPRGAFVPPPTVDSAILLVSNISRGNFEAKTLSDKVRPTPQEAAFREERFFEIIKAGFAQKRKMLKSNLEPVFGNKALEAMQNAGIPSNARAEDVPLESWIALSSNSL